MEGGRDQGDEAHGPGPSGHLRFMLPQHLSHGGTASWPALPGTVTAFLCVSLEESCFTSGAGRVGWEEAAGVPAGLMLLQRGQRSSPSPSRLPRALTAYSTLTFFQRTSLLGSQVKTNATCPEMGLAILMGFYCRVPPDGCGVGLWPCFQSLPRLKIT